MNMYKGSRYTGRSEFLWFNLRKDYYSYGFIGLHYFATVNSMDNSKKKL